MHAKKASLVTLALSIVCAHHSLTAGERNRNKFKIAAIAVTLASVGGRAALDPQPGNFLLNEGKDFTSGLIAGSSSIFVPYAGAYLGNYVTDGHSAGNVVGGATGVAWGISSLASIESISMPFILGCYCGTGVGISAARLVARQ